MYESGEFQIEVILMHFVSFMPCFFYSQGRYSGPNWRTNLPSCTTRWLVCDGAPRVHGPFSDGTRRKHAENVPHIGNSPNVCSSSLSNALSNHPFEFSPSHWRYIGIHQFSLICCHHTFMKPLAGDFLDVSGKFYGNFCFHFSFLDQFEREIKRERGNSVIHGGAVKWGSRISHLGYLPNFLCRHLGCVSLSDIFPNELWVMLSD